MAIKSKRQRIAALNEKIAKLQVEVSAIEAEAGDEVEFAEIKVGQIVAFTFGRGDTKVEKEGTILGVKAGEGKSPALVRIAVGTGFDSEVRTVSPTAILRVVTDEFVPAAA